MLLNVAECCASSNVSLNRKGNHNATRRIPINAWCYWALGTRSRLSACGSRPVLLQHRHPGRAHRDAVTPHQPRQNPDRDRRRLHPHSADQTQSGHVLRPDPDGNIFNYVYSKGSGNRSQYANPEVDKLLEQTRAVSDQAERKKLYSQVNKILTDESPMIYIQHRPEVKVMAKQVKGFVHNPDGMMRFAGVSLAR